MNINNKLTALLTTLTLIFCCSIPVYADSTSGNFANDSIITAKIKTKMLTDPAVSSLKIKVETNNGVVSLTGTVPTDTEASAAIITAESTPDVINVDASKLMVQKSNQPLSDAVITAKIKGTYIRNKVFGDMSTSITDIKVETKNGVVYLTGNATRSEADNAVKLAKTIDGVKKVDSKIVIKE